MFYKESFIRSKFKSLLLKLFKIIENNGNPNHQTNGEALFIKHLFQNYLNKSKDKKIFFDIGANTGMYSTMLIEQSRVENTEYEIHCFEPAKATFAALQENLGSRENVVLVNKAISDTKEKKTIFYDTEKSGLASLYKRNLKAHSIAFNKSEIIKAIRLDEYIRNTHVSHIHFMKIDIEGHELTAFKGMGNYLNADFIDFIQFEYGGANLDSKTSLMEFYELFEEKGFKIAKIMPKGLQLRDYKPYMENFDYANYVAISNNCF